MRLHRRLSPERREERKERTRRGLLEAALELMAEDRSFTSLSLRRVARRAGITPNAFYRHFDGMEELGLALVDEIGPALRRLLREVRKAGHSKDETVRRSVDVYLRFVQENRPYFAFIVRERAGGSPRIRAAIRRDMGYFASELAADMAELGPRDGASRRAVELMAELVVEVMLGVNIEILDLDPTDTEALLALKERFVRRVVLVILGARAWDDERSDKKRLPEARASSVAS